MGLRGFGFGLGFLIYPEFGPLSEGTYSWGGAASTTFWIDPVKEVVGIFMTQIVPEALIYPSQFRTLAYRAIYD